MQTSACLGCPVITDRAAEGRPASVRWPEAAEVGSGGGVLYGHGGVGAPLVEEGRPASVRWPEVTEVGPGINTESAFTLVELMVAMFIVVLLFLAFGRALTTSLQTSRENRLAQEATGIASEYIEMARSLTWAELGMSSIDAQAPLLGESGDTLSATVTGGESDEPLVYTVDGVVSPKVVESIDDTSFDVWAYVSETGDLRRVVIEVRWVVEAGSRSFRTSTLVSEVTAG